MPKLWILGYLVFCLFCSAVRAESPQLMKVFSREAPIQLEFELNDKDWRWLGKKKEIKVGVYDPKNPPFALLLEPDIFEGIAADYTLLIAHSLGVRVKVMRYSDRDAAIDGLNQGQVDMLVDYANDITDEAHFKASIPFTPDAIALVSREEVLTRNLKKPQNIRIALLNDSLSDEWVAKYYPQAKTVRYASPATALSSVAFGNNDYFIGSFATVSYLVERNYDSLLSIAEILSTEETGPHFLFRKDENVLQHTVNTVLAAIPPAQRKAISHHWSSGSDLWEFQSRLALTEREQRWLDQNREVRVVINPLYAPFTMLDANGQFYGISADVLRLIHLRTGLHFKAVEADNVAEMFQKVSQNEGDLIAAMSYSDERDKQLIFTRPYIQPPFVLIVKNSTTAPKGLSDVKSLAITPGNSLWEWIKTQYPHIKLVKAENASLAMQWVKEKKVDGAVHNLIGANYMIDSYFRNELKIATRIGDNLSHISFAVQRDEPELYSILNKALADISPRDISVIAYKWQGTPTVKLNTWTVYRWEFYWLAGIFVALVLISLSWNYYLRQKMSKRKKAQMKLKEQVEFRETLFNSMLVPVYVVDREGNILSRNQAWEDFFKLDIKYLDKLALTSPSHPLAIVYSTLKEMLKDSYGSPLLRHRYTIKNGDEICVIIHQAVPYMGLNGEIVGFICSWQDITEHEALLLELSSERERAEQANRTKSTFLATMSHEIRTPISAIIGLLELTVTNKTFTKNDMEAVQVAYESAKSLMDLIGEILDMAKIESGELELAPKWTDFDELVQPIVRVFEGLARQKNLTLYSHIDARHPDEIFIDPMRVHQVLSNLISNAIKFTEQGSIEIGMKCLRKKDQHMILELVVSDTGVGIAEEDQGQIFTPYKQSDAGKMQVGTGLGLAICMQLVKMMGGVITLRSEQGKGTHITVHLPVEHRQFQPASTESITTVIDRMQPLKILAVDDHPANRLLLKSQLTRLGHFVVEAENGEQALELWRKNDLDLVITDCNMPVMDGITLTRLLRQETARPVTIFGLTANAQAEERARYLAAGMDDCLFKPLQLAQLEALLNKVVRRVIQNKPTQKQLGSLVDLSALRQLVNDNTELLQQLLLTTRNENVKDIQQARLCIEKQDHAGLARCFHRMAGAAQILGASDVERHCRELESYAENVAYSESLRQKSEQVLELVTQLNDAIDDFLTNEKPDEGLI
ncbi:transporter substrate-binding domain-containing protein [Acinetobacter dispersus]|uniref:transporter substrate-binding domain-containing protein n=1 Tax=Acinetobacter dispersus TaxID=70348 RepID=UPI001F4BBFAC|nr:transporter substrate-binding domain-containing protein [Acinetobacter dispersus]MCH7385434.1 transporter substrate-binding domain-containing protein [Acinetobacter dispersus]